jgi:hypothetical protein
MRVDNHIPAYKRIEVGRFTGPRIINPIKYKPSVIRDLLCAMKDFIRKFKDPSPDHKFLLEPFKINRKTTGQLKANNSGS